MPKFTLKKVEQIKGKITIFKLINNGKCDFDEYCENANEKRIGKLFARLQSYSELKLMRKHIFRELSRDSDDNIKDYEVKIDNDRIYLIKLDSGSVVAIVGTKNNQRSDIRKLRKIKKELINDNKGRIIKK